MVTMRRAGASIGVAHPSEPNYVAVLGGSAFGIADDNPYFMNSVTTNIDASGGWHVVRAQRRGTNDNSLGAVAGSEPNDVWAVGNFLPDTPGRDAQPGRALRRARAAR